MRQILLSLLTGGVCGVVFGMFRLPIPAPPSLAGVAGIVGIFLGFVLVRSFYH